MAIWIFRVVAVMMLAVTVCPLFRTGQWFIRVWDFPRLQISCVFLIVFSAALLAAWRSARKREFAAWAALSLGALGWQVSHVVPFSIIWPTEVPQSIGNETLRLIVANLKEENDNFADVADQISAEDPDILLLIENDQKWANGLRELRNRFDFHHEVIRGEGLGMALWSNVEIENAKIEHLVSDRRASIWATLQWPSGQQVNFVGVHPTPPGLLDSTGAARRDSRVRDAELILIAKRAAEESDSHWVIAGDFNDVAWSHTTRLFKRISGLKDPRIGRSFLGTFHAEYPLFRVPIDHVFVSRSFSVGSLYRKTIDGSDHFAVITDLVLDNPDAKSPPDPKGDDRQEAAKIVGQGREDAEQRGVR